MFKTCDLAVCLLWERLWKPGVFYTELFLNNPTAVQSFGYKQFFTQVMPLVFQAGFRRIKGVLFVFSTIYTAIPMIITKNKLIKGVIV